MTRPGVVPWPFLLGARVCSKGLALFILYIYIVGYIYLYLYIYLYVYILSWWGYCEHRNNLEFLCKLKRVSER